MLEVKINPVPKPRMTKSDRWKKRPCVVRYWDFKDKLKEACKDIDIGDTLSVSFHIPTPKSWSKKKAAEMHLKPHKSKPDLDNLVKALQDALLDEDSHIWKYKNVEKVWDNEGKIIFFLEKA